jgi:hypothetical protein
MVFYWGKNLLLYSSYLPLGVPNWTVMYIITTTQSIQQGGRSLPGSGKKLPVCELGDRSGQNGQAHSGNRKIARHTGGLDHQAHGGTRSWGVHGWPPSLLPDGRGCAQPRSRTEGVCPRARGHAGWWRCFSVCFARIDQIWIDTTIGKRMIQMQIQTWHPGWSRMRSSRKPGDAGTLADQNSNEN